MARKRKTKTKTTATKSKAKKAAPTEVPEAEDVAPAAEAPATEVPEPKTEEPAVAEPPIVEEPTVEEPVVEEVVEEPVAEEVVEEPVVEEPVAEEVVEEPVVEEPVVVIEDEGFDPWALTGEAVTALWRTSMAWTRWQMAGLDLLIQAVGSTHDHLAGWERSLVERREAASRDAA